MWGGNEAITNEEANELDEQWKPMRQSLPPLKTEQSKKEGVSNHGLSQVWTSFHLHHLLVSSIPPLAWSMVKLWSIIINSF